MKPTTLADSSDDERAKNTDRLKGFENYKVWSLRVAAKLKAKGYWSLIDRSYVVTPPTSKDSSGKQDEYNSYLNSHAKALSFLISCCDDIRVSEIAGCSLASDAWELLKTSYGGNDLMSRATHLIRAFGTSLKEDGDIEEFIRTISSARNELKAMGTPLADIELALVVLMRLPKSMEQARQHFMLRSYTTKDPLTFDAVMSYLKTNHVHSKIENQVHTSEANLARHPAKVGEVCQFCQRQGHKADRCYRLIGCPICKDKSCKGPQSHPRGVKGRQSGKYASAQVTSVTNKDNLPVYSDVACAGYALQSTGSTSATWLLDSGASHHYCNQRDLFTSYEPYSPEHRLTIKCANSHVLTGFGCGNVKMEWFNGHHYEPQTISKVVFVPGISSNLLSVSALEDTGHEIVIRKGEARFIRQGMVTGTARRQGSLYIVNGRTCSDEKYYAQLTEEYQAPKLTYDLWHRRLAHIGSHVLDKLIRNGNVKVSKMSNHRCLDCMVGKSHRHPVPVTRVRPEGILDEVHMDTFSPKIVGIGNVRHMVMFTDALSGYTSVFSQRTKSGSETLANFKNFRNIIEAFTQRKIKILHGDNGTEFINDDFEKYCRNSGILRTDSTPYIHEQNGIAERKNRTVANLARAMMHAAGCSPWYWPEAFQYAVYVLNRVPTGTHASPYEMILGHTPSLDMLRVWGCIAVAHEESDRRANGKFTNRGVVGRFVGIDVRKKCYRILVHGKVELYYSVRFLEQNFRLQDHSYAEPSLPSIEWSSVTDTDLGLVDLPSSKEAEDDPDSTLNAPQKNMNSPHAQDESPNEDSDAVQIESPVEDAPNLDLDTEPNDNPPQSPSRRSRRSHSRRSNRSPTRVTTPQAPQRPKPSMDIRYSSPPSPIPLLRGSQSKLPVRSQACDRLVEEEQPASSYSIPDEDDDEEYAGIAIAGSNVVIPDSYSAALKSPEAAFWIPAIQAEYDALKENDTWELVELPPGRKAIDTRWILTSKYNSAGEIIRYKARLVAKGYAQKAGVDFGDTFAPTARLSSFRTVIALAAKYGWKMYQMDVSSAFLNADLAETVYVRQPEGHVEPGKEHMVWRLKRALYGLKQSPRAWNQNVDTFMKSQGYVSTQADPCVYVRIEGTSRSVIVLYVDDLIFTGNDELLTTSIRAALTRRYKMKDLGELEWCLGIKVTSSDDGRTIQLSQQQYIKSLLTRFRMEEAIPAGTPIDKSVHLSSKHSPSSEAEHRFMANRPYRELIGALQYLAVATRPDIAAVSLLSQFLNNPGETHWTAAKRVLRYLKGTSDLSLTYHGDCEATCVTSYQYNGPSRNAVLRVNTRSLSAFTDADYATDTDDRRSHTGFVLQLCGGPVAWKSQKQPTVALSTLEAEYMAMSCGAQEIIHLRSLLQDLGEKVAVPTPLFADNEGAIAVAHNPQHHNRVKHIDIRHHFVRERALVDDISVIHVPADL